MERIKKMEKNREITTSETDWLGEKCNFSYHGVCHGYNSYTGAYDKCCHCQRACCREHSIEAPQNGHALAPGSRICLECWDISKKFYNALAELDKEYIKKTDEIRETMTVLCKENMEKKSDE